MLQPSAASWRSVSNSLTHGLRRQHRGRLVEDQQLRGPAAGSARSRRAGARRPKDRAPAAPDRSACRIAATVRAPAATAPARSKGAAHRKRDVLDDRDGFEQREMLVDHLDAERARNGGVVGFDRAAVAQDLAAVGLHRAVDDLHQRRFAGAVLAEHGVDFAGHDRQRYVVIGDDTGIALADVAQFEARDHRGTCRAATRSEASATVAKRAGCGPARFGGFGRLPGDQPSLPLMPATSQFVARMSLSESTDPAGTRTVPSWSLISPA